MLGSPGLYHVPREEVAALLTTLVRLPAFKVRDRRVVLTAMRLYGARNLDFGDAMLLAAMELAGATEIFSYDTDFDRIPDVRRVEP